MFLETCLVVDSAFPEKKYFELCKNSDTPWSSDVGELFNSKVVSPKKFADIKDELDDLSWRDNFVYTIYDGWHNLEG